MAFRGKAWLNKAERYGCPRTLEQWETARFTGLAEAFYIKKIEFSKRSLHALQTNAWLDE